MDVLEQLQEDLQSGRLDAARLLELMATLQHKLQDAQHKLQDAQHKLQDAHLRIAELEQQLANSKPDHTDEPFSLRAEEKRQQARGQKKPPPKTKGRRGRVSTKDKIEQAERTEDVFPDGVEPNQCRLSHTRPVWRLEQGRAVLVAYRIFRGPKSQYGQIPGVLGRSEFGLEIVVEIAYLVYVIGLSFDKVCQLLHFFQTLTLRKSQVDALLKRLSRHWEQEFEILCTLLANSLVVHADETSWSLNSVWAFLSEKARLLFFGVHKDGDTLKKILDPETFAGLVISDDAAVYGNFSASQKCWAHLLRKAIKLTLQAPNNVEYRDFTDGLLEIYHRACRVQRDGRLGDAGRARKMADLDDAIFDLCSARWTQVGGPLEGHADDYRLLVNELMRLMLAQQLFVFVTTPPVEPLQGEGEPVAGTNNEAERTLRGSAQARKTGRTNKTLAGARRQTILSSVLESLRLYLPSYTLADVLAEIQSWWHKGLSCFAAHLEKLHLACPETGVLDQVLPSPDG